MRCLPTIRAALGMTAFLPFSLCVAQTIDATEQLRGPLEPPPTTTDARPFEPASLNDVHLNVVDQKLALSLAVDTWGQIASGEAALPSIQSEALKRLLTERLETQRDFLKTLETLTGGRCCEAIEQAVDEIERDAKVEKPRIARFRPLALSRNATAMIVRIRVEILQQYTAAINKQLANQSGEQFDRHFLRGPAEPVADAGHAERLRGASIGRFCGGDRGGGGERRKTPGRKPAGAAANRNPPFAGRPTGRFARCRSRDRTVVASRYFRGLAVC